MTGDEISHDHTLTRQLGARALAVGAGEPGVPPVLLLHGFTDSADTWRPVMATLAEGPIRAVAVDLPQFGTSERSTDTNIINAHDSFIARAISSLDDGSGVVVVGNSFGGWGAIRAALSNTAVRGVVAISPAGLPTGGLVGNRMARLLLDLAVAVPRPWSRRRRSEAPDRVTAAVLGHIYARAGSTEPVSREVVDHYRSHIRRGDLRLWLTLASAMLDDVTAPYALDIATLSTPLHLIWGDRDPFVTASGAHFAYEQNPEMVTVEVLNGVGHCAQFQCPDLVADSIIALCRAGGLPPPRWG